MTDKPKETSMKDGVTSDHDSPYYIHPSDYPRQMHVSEALTDGNYVDWSQEMINFLLSENKMGFIDGTIKRPDQTAAEYMGWMRCDVMIKGWLNTAMEKEIRNSVKYASTAEEMWKDLSERFGKQSAPRAYELKQRLTATRQDGASVSTYYTKLRVMWDELQSVLPNPRCSCDGCSCGIGKKLEDVKEKERLYEFLLGVDGEYSTIRTQILAMNPIPTLGAAYHLVSEDEQQRNVTTGKRNIVDATAFQAFVPSKRDVHQQPNKNNQTESKQNAGDQIEHCTHCNKDGHNRDGCFKRIGYLEWWPGKGTKREKTKPRAACVESETSPMPGLTGEQYQQFLNLFARGAKTNASPAANMASVGPTANTTGNYDKRNSWIVDSGATDHVTHMASILENRTKSAHELPVTIANGERIAVEGRGDYILKDGTKIKGVLHIPEFNCNLLSVSKISTDLQCEVTFFPDFFVMQGLTSRTLIGAGKCKDGLYQMGMVEDKRQAMMATIDIWHSRLGHASSTKWLILIFLKIFLLGIKIGFVILVLKPNTQDHPFLLVLLKLMVVLI